MACIEYLFHVAWILRQSSSRFWVSLISNLTVVESETIACLCLPLGIHWGYLCCLMDGQYLHMLHGTWKDIFSSFSLQGLLFTHRSLLLLMLISPPILIFIFCPVVWRLTCELELSSSSMLSSLSFHIPISSVVFNHAVFLTIACTLYCDRCGRYPLCSRGPQSSWMLSRWIPLSLMPACDFLCLHLFFY